MVRHLYGIYQKVPNGSKFRYDRLVKTKIPLTKKEAVEILQPLVDRFSMEGIPACLRPVK
jgi:hypothetical protein